MVLSTDIAIIFELQANSSEITFLLYNDVGYSNILNFCRVLGTSTDVIFDPIFSTPLFNLELV